MIKQQFQQTQAKISNKQFQNPMIQQQSINQQPDEYEFRVGNTTIEGVTLVDKSYNIIQLPVSMLPHGSQPGSIIRITLMRDVELQRKEDDSLVRLMQKLESGGETIVDTNEFSEDTLGGSASDQKNKVTLQNQPIKSIQVSNSQRSGTNVMKKKPLPPIEEKSQQKTNHQETNTTTVKQQSNPNSTSRHRRSSMQKQNVNKNK